MHGWLILDKPLGVGSTQAVSAVKRALRQGGYGKAKVGHGGTLDPLASGVLPVAIGEATKLAGRMLDSDKVYEFTIGFGAQTSTLDAEGEVVATSTVRPTRAALEAVLPRFTGPIEQEPPAYSALKVDGERAYDLARAGEEVVLATRSVTVHSLNSSLREAWGGGPPPKAVVEGPQPRSGEEGTFPPPHPCAVGPPPPSPFLWVPPPSPQGGEGWGGGGRRDAPGGGGRRRRGRPPPSRRAALARHLPRCAGEDETVFPSSDHPFQDRVDVVVQALARLAFAQPAIALHFEDILKAVAHARMLEPRAFGQGDGQFGHLDLAVGL